MDNRIHDSWDKIEPDAAARTRMLSGILRKTEKKDYNIRRIPRVSLAAAVCVLVLTVSALAAGVSIWAQKQAELRALLAVEGKDIPEYAEYTVSEELASSTEELEVTVLSALQEAYVQKYYIMVSPVTQEQAEKWVWLVSVGDDIWGGEACPVGELEDAYDTGSQSLLLEVVFSFGEDIDADEIAPFNVVLHGGPGIVDDVGEWFEPCVQGEFLCEMPDDDIEIRRVSFGEGVPYANELTGETGLLLGAEVHVGGVTWVHTLCAEEAFAEEWESLSETEADERMERILSWSRILDDAVSGAVLQFADGTEVSGLLPEQTFQEEDVYYTRTSFAAPVEMELLTGIVVEGVLYTPMEE